jgi:tetratricopeptide (TPR) repeat protein
MHKHKLIATTILTAFIVTSCQLTSTNSKMKVDDADPNPAFTCPITNEIFVDPVIAEDGHTYERAAITDWLNKNSISPLSRIEIKVENLRPNLLVKSMMDEFYRCEEEAKTLKDNNAEFSSKFSIEIGKLPAEKVLEKRLEKEYDKIRENLKVEAFICPLTKNIFQEPVIAADNYTYEKIAITEWLIRNDTSPKTNQKLLHKNLLPNHATKSMIDLFKQEHDGWKNLKQTEKRFLFLFAPKIQELLQKEVATLEQKAAERLLFDWQSSVHLNKEELVKRQTELNAYSLKEDKFRFQIPLPTKVFVGRERELKAIEDIFSEKNIVCLVGSGGMGKSQLAAEYIYRSKRPASIWLYGDNKLLTFQIQTYLEKAHKIDLTKEKDQTALLKKFYESIGNDAIVVIDNIENKESIQEFLPTSDSIKIIITSRYRDWRFPTIVLSQFSDTETLKYLAENFSESDNPPSLEDVQHLNQILAGVPLAISQAVACINQNPGLTIKNYCSRFKEELNFPPLNSDSSDSNYGLSQVYTTLILALHNLRGLNNQIDLLLNVIGYMAPGKVDKHIAVSFLESQDPKNFSKTRIKKIKQLFKVLCDYSILFQTSKDENIYSINSLTQSVIRMIHKKNGVFEKNFTQFATWLQTNLFYNERSLDDIARVYNFIPHGLAIASIEGSDFYMNKDLLLRQIGYHQFYSIKNYLQAKTCFEYALQISETYHSYDKDTYVRILNDLGCVNSELGNYDEQLRLHTKALNVSEKFLGKNSEITAQVLTNLGDAYGHLGRYDTQRDTLLRALEIKEKYLCLDKNDISISKTLVHLGTAYGNLGDHKKKRDILTRALAISERYYGKNHLETAVILMNLGNANRHLGKGHDSIEFLSKALQTVEKRFGTDHPDFALAAMNLGVGYMELGEYAQALKFLELSLKITEKHFGPNNPKTAGVLVNLGLVYNHMKEESKSKSYTERAYQIMFDQYGPNHPETQKVLQNIGSSGSGKEVVDMMQNFMQGFNEKERQHLATDEKLLEKEFYNFTEKFFEKNESNHEKQAALLNFVLAASKRESNNKSTIEECDMLISLGKSYLQRKYKEAVTTLEQALTINEKLRGKTDISMGTLLTDLGNAYNQLDQYERALVLLSRGLEVNEKHLGKNHHITAITLTNLGATYSGLGDQVKNKEFTERAYNIFLKKYGSNHQWMQDALFNLNLAEKKLLKLRNAIPNHPPAPSQEEVNVMNNLKMAFILDEKYGQGFVKKHGLKKAMDVDMHEFSVHYDEEEHGLNHPATLNSLIELGELYNSLNYREKAIENLTRALLVSEALYGKEHLTTKKVKASLAKFEQNLHSEGSAPMSKKCVIY